MNDCLFCKIVRKEIPAAIIFEDDRSLAFLDIQPRSPGHTVVIAKYHSENLLDLPDSEVEPLFLAVKKVASRLAGKLMPDGLTIGVNQGSVSGQTVPHLHIHIMPRFMGDGGGSIQDVVEHSPREGLAEILEKIKL